MQNSDAGQQIEGRIRLCHIDEIGDSQCQEFRLGEGDWPLRVFLVRDGKAVSAFRNVCPHAGMPLNWKPEHFLTRDQSAIICSSHGALFDKTTGECFAGPCVGRALTGYALEIDAAGWITVKI